MKAAFQLSRALRRSPRAGPSRLHRDRHRALRVLRLILQPVAVGGAVWLAFQLPLPLLDAWLPLKNIVGAGLAVASAGVCLYNTLFYDHFRP